MNVLTKEYEEEFRSWMKDCKYKSQYDNLLNQRNDTNNHFGDFLTLSLSKIFDIWDKNVVDTTKFLATAHSAYSAVFRRYISLLKIYEIAENLSGKVARKLAKKLWEKLDKESVRNSQPKKIERLFSQLDTAPKTYKGIEDAIDKLSLNTSLPVNNTSSDSNESKDDESENDTIKDSQPNPLEGLPRQIIFYGAPGNGKSNAIKSFLEKKNIWHKRITFHPEMDYVSFVGGYIPCTVDNNSGGKDIIYEYVPQGFIDCYVEAYKNPDKSVVLVIEEINRGNCAQIFGDIFQLLDRVNDQLDPDNGESEYPITPDKFLDKWLEDKWSENKIQAHYDHKLKLPANFYIWATMNVSDQSLFPIDAAFFRRWDMRYFPVGKGHDTRIEGTVYTWEKVQDRINKMMDDNGIPDKKLGKYFIKEKKPGEDISVEEFVSKVVYYLYKYIFPVYSIHEELMKKFPFDKFYKGDPNCLNIPVDDKKVKEFLEDFIGPIESSDNSVANGGTSQLSSQNTHNINTEATTDNSVANDGASQQDSQESQEGIAED